MNLEAARRLLLSLSHVDETSQWGDNLLFWVADKAIGGKMCAIISLSSQPASPASPFAIISYPTTPDRFADLLEIEGFTPARYLARLHWVSAASWSVLRTPEWEQELRSAHALTLAKLSPRTRKILTLPKTEQNRIVAERKALEASKAKKSAGHLTSSPN